MRFRSMLALLALCACDTNSRAPRPAAHEHPPVRITGHEDTHAPARAVQRDFGAPIDQSLPLTALAEILASPETHAEQIVRTRGVVHRVCQRMGCWMELRDGDGPAVRVPMGGHAFFLPKDAAGVRAEVQGRVVLRALSPEARAHLESEGATALASLVSIDASGVHLDTR